MKQTIILWTAAIFTTFLAGYLVSVTSSGYPVSGEIGIEGKKVSYLLQTAYTAKDSFSVLIKSDIPGITGNVEWSMESSKEDWKQIRLKDTNNVIIAKLPAQQPLGKIIYRVVLTRGNNLYLLPPSKPVIAQFKGKVPSAINILLAISLFGGLIFGTRAGLEFFRGGKNEKKLALLTFVFFFINAIVLTPIKKIIEADALAHSIMPVYQMFSLSTVLIFILWIIAVLVRFNLPKLKHTVFFTAVLSLLLFLFLR